MSEADWDGVADLTFHRLVVAAELVAGGESLEQRSFTQADRTVLGGVYKSATGGGSAPCRHRGSRPLQRDAAVGTGGRRASGEFQALVAVKLEFVRQVEVIAAYGDLANAFENPRRGYPRPMQRVCGGCDIASSGNHVAGVWWREFERGRQQVYQRVGEVEAGVMHCDADQPSAPLGDAEIRGVDGPRAEAVAVLDGGGSKLGPARVAG